MIVRTPRLIRRATDPLFRRVPVPILGGANRGRWWCLASAGGQSGSGRRAGDQMRTLSVLIHTGAVVWDVGAHHGYYTLLASRSVGPAGQVHAFEPSAKN